MRWDEFRTTLNESGLSKKYLQKHRGQYLDVLINLIATNKDVELEGGARDKHGKTVKFEKRTEELMLVTLRGNGLGIISGAAPGQTAPPDCSQVCVFDGTIKSL